MWGSAPSFRVTVQVIPALISTSAGTLRQKCHIKIGIRSRKRIAKGQSVCSAYKSKIKWLLGDGNAKRFEGLYERRSDFLHDGRGRGTLGEDVNVALDISLALLLADIAQSAAESIA
jgi:hypothetical protein